MERKITVDCSLYHTLLSCQYSFISERMHSEKQSIAEVAEFSVSGSDPDRYLVCTRFVITVIIKVTEVPTYITSTNASSQ
jgi:hypothetical protein